MRKIIMFFVGICCMTFFTFSINASDVETHLQVEQSVLEYIQENSNPDFLEIGETVQFPEKFFSITTEWFYYDENENKLFVSVHVTPYSAQYVITFLDFDYCVLSEKNSEMQTIYANKTYDSSGCEINYPFTIQYYEKQFMLEFDIPINSFPRYFVFTNTWVQDEKNVQEKPIIFGLSKKDKSLHSLIKDQVLACIGKNENINYFDENSYVDFLEEDTKFSVYLHTKTALEKTDFMDRYQSKEMQEEENILYSLVIKRGENVKALEIHDYDFALITKKNDSKSLAWPSQDDFWVKCNNEIIEVNLKFQIHNEIPQMLVFTNLKENKFGDIISNGQIKACHFPMHMNSEQISNVRVVNLSGKDIKSLYVFPSEIWGQKDEILNQTYLSQLNNMCFADVAAVSKDFIQYKNSKWRFLFVFPDSTKAVFEGIFDWENISCFIIVPDNSIDDDYKLKIIK